ncbi:MAG: hypothetical protein AAB482_01555 [Patescibacteria group bacterium]
MEDNAQCDGVIDERTPEQVAADLAIVGRANCGCWYSAEQGIPCEHDIALAR